MSKNTFLLFIFFIVFLVVSPLSIAVDTSSLHHITLLAVTDYGNGNLSGSTADLYLRVTPGTGSVFLESYPLAKIDTQVATRLSNEIACEFSSTNCQQYDFFYTIRANSPIIGGPSAGGATALLTLSVLDAIPLRNDFAMTGAISSGGVIVPVAGIKEKVQAAAEQNYTRVLVPSLSFVVETSNSSKNETLKITNEQPLSVKRLDNINNITVLPVLTLHDALSATAKKPLPPIQQTHIQPPKDYVKKMNTTAFILCNRTTSMLSQISFSQKNTSAYTFAMTYYNKSQEQFLAGFDYAAASFCYTANIRLRELLLENVSNKILQNNFERLRLANKEFESALEKQPLNTFSDLETYSIVKERLVETDSYLDSIDLKNISKDIFAIAIERHYSALAWSAFFGLKGVPLQLDKENVHVACLQELQQVESRLNYLQLFLTDDLLSDVRTSLGQAYKYSQDDEYALCLFKATKAKAESDLFLSTLGMSEKGIRIATKAKQERAATVIAEQTKQHAFPLLGYSYYEYGLVLADSEPYSSLLFTEYALGLSDLTGYFPVDKKTIILPEFRVALYAGLAGFFIGILFARMIFSRKKKQQRKSRSKKR